MDSRKKTLFTFDYELFLGKDSGTVLQTMIIPTNKILKTFSRLKLKSIFFVDATYLSRLTQLADSHPSCKADLQLIEQQLHQLLSDQHEIGLHIHPHWLDAKYNAKTNRWDLSDNKRFAVSNLSATESEMVFKDAYAVLMNIIKKKYPTYQIKSFRAGGLFIQPFTTFQPYFEALKIEYDFSVLRNSKWELDHCRYDFKNVPLDFFYSFNNDVIEKDETGKFKEYTIDQIELSIFFKILNSIYFRVSSFFLKPDTHGSGNAPNIDDTETKKKTIGNYVKSKYKETLSIENCSIVKFIPYLLYLKKTSYIHFISHPKLIRPGQLKLFYCLIATVNFSKRSLRFDYENWLR
ncbi:MAG TPA: hypothetical protein VFF27_03385 [Bacteroidia bacterium]|jgi:hypothetical protein|nr:hypothetical protein [Bacteroidia bacterium]